MAALQFTCVTLIFLLIFFQKVSLKLTLSAPRRYRIDFFLTAIEFNGKERKNRSARFIKLRSFFSGFRKWRPRLSSLRYLIRHSEVGTAKDEGYDLVLHFYLFHLVFAFFILAKNKLSYGIKRRIENVGK